ncbi:hypothetical protein TI39_contig418g00019 [Zymoseptoria brevis]|uniref:NHL repeat-containing protein n=1 Tax=Zymoseptoria brevis TaxID=1047168 RepID=A0A0F4GLN5_9PEZI|nr:hypothetical protein TI39_contig418g00019 [Zymoseptoria brevis]
MLQQLPCLTAFLCLITSAFALPTVEYRQQKDGRFIFHPMKASAAGPCDLVEGPDGALWGQDILVNYIFRIDPSTGKLEEYPIPFTTPISNHTIPGLNNKLVQNRTALSCAIRKGEDGQVCFANGLGNQLGRIDPHTKKIQIFQPPGTPAGNLLNFNDLYSAKAGIYLTQTTGNVFNFFCFATERFTTYNVATPLAVPLGLLVPSDEKVYIAELVGNKILVFDPKTKAIDEYPLPQPAQFPAVVRAERFGAFSSINNLRVASTHIHIHSRLAHLGLKNLFW